MQSMDRSGLARGCKEGGTGGRNDDLEMLILLSGIPEDDTPPSTQQPLPAYG
jgi:hypothetical protein